jgi:site-specific recombinase XerD
VGRALDRTILRRLIHTTGERAGVADAHPHRFRHTFAITFLRNGGNVFALQTILGHESLEMVKRYLKIAQTDLQKAHQDASPVMNWLL